MKGGLKKVLSYIGVSVLSLASVFSLLFVTIKNNRDLSLQNASISGDVATHGGGG